jgi:hypothetical protein
MKLSARISRQGPARPLADRGFLQDLDRRLGSLAAALAAEAQKGGSAPLRFRVEPSGAGG